MSFVYPVYIECSLVFDEENQPKKIRNQRSSFRLTGDTDTRFEDETATAEEVDATVVALLVEDDALELGTPFCCGLLALFTPLPPE
ncbi:hypothetical protein DERP_014062 [Dermatophagoides pteronyssinus]|uniref:Uncharacterized protein n=1 Tax=Dermatophagoides pteronyssinus TaxID=6956 RepID=A0ABQ8J691_DERPT|nr:hypothetical protein DERP_014062 [Dermatophagoides pteronyssinus]